MLKKMLLLCFELVNSIIWCLQVISFAINTLTMLLTIVLK